METIIKDTITCGQDDLKDMSITQNGTLTVHTAEGVELPHVKVENATMEMGHGEIRAYKEIKKNFFCGRRTLVLHTGQGNIARIAMMLDKDGSGVITIRGNFKDVIEARMAVEEANKTIAADTSLVGLDFQREAALLNRNYSRDKKAYDRSEEKRVAELLQQEEADKARIREAFKAPSTSPFGGVQ